MRYKADITAGALKLPESRLIADLLLRQVDAEGWRDAIVTGEGWHPLLASKVYSAEDRLQITGDLNDQFQELYLTIGEALDAHSPIFVRAQEGKPDIFDVTFLRSDHFGVHHRKAIAFRKRIASFGEDTILEAASDDATANYAVGDYILWELDDPSGARPYLERAAAGGILDALFDLAIIELFPRGE